MGASKKTTSLNCELRIVRAKNVSFVTKGHLFVRYYLRTGNGSRICLNTREILFTSDPCWNESITLECFGGEDALDRLKQQTVVFELRWRKASPVYGKLVGSKLLFRSEMGWKDVSESADLSLEKWITTTTTSKYVPEGLKPPALQIGMKVQIPEMLEMPKRCHRRTKWDECGCVHGECNGRDDDVFALAAGLVVL